GENRVDVIAQAGDRLISELPAAVVEHQPAAGDLEAVEDVHCADADADMRHYRPAGREVVKDVAHYRIGMSVAADPIRAFVIFGHAIAAIAVLFFEAPRRQLVATAGAHIVAG